jgi:[CysO sulfur-carrier protein]-S-L-cysteine hydrolase
VISEFKITNKHYQILLKQGFDNLPYETGGFVGGEEGAITGILPTFNKDWDQSKEVFKIDNSDMQRAHSFFKKHNIKFFGIYHTHPTGIAYPSDADISTGQRFHFIISYKDQNNPDFRVYQIDNNKPRELKLTVIPDSGFSSSSQKKEKDQFLYSQKQVEDELSQRINNIILDNPNVYKKLPPKAGNLDSDFSALV